MASPRSDLESLRRDLAAGRIDPAYLLLGEESFLKEEALREIRQAVLGAGEEAVVGNLAVFEGASCSMGEILDAARTLPMFAPRRLVWVRECEKMKDPEVEALRGYLESASPSATLVFSTGAGKPDARRALLRLLQSSARVLEFPLLKGSAVPAWIRRRAAQLEVQLDPDAALLLELQVGPDLRRLDQELRKAIEYVAPSRAISAGILEETLGAPSGGSGFDFAEVSAAGDAESAIRLLRRILADGEEPVRLLFLLARQLRILIQGKELLGAGKGGRDLAAALGIPPYPFLIDKVQKQIRQFPSRASAPALRLILRSDRALKAGAGKPSGILERLVLDLARLLKTPGAVRGAES